MSGLVTLAGWMVYGLGWLVSAVATTRWNAARSKCHSEGGYHWSTYRNCRQCCPPTCWRPDGNPSAIDALIGTGAALVWPAILIPLVVWWLANRETARPLVTAARIAELERELGMDVAQ